MATHSSVLAWRIPGIGEPGGLPSMGLDRVGHDWSDLAAAAAAADQVSGYMTLSILNAIDCVLCSDINCFDEARTKDPNPVVSLQAWNISILSHLGECKPSKKRGLQRTDFKLMLGDGTWEREPFLNYESCLAHLWW